MENEKFRFRNEEAVRIMDNIVRSGVTAKVSALDAVKITKYINYVYEIVFFDEECDIDVFDDIERWRKILSIVILENECKENRRSSTLEFYDLV